MPAILRILKADGLLLVAAAIWGSAFTAQRVGMHFLGPFLFNGVRFALGALSLLPIILLRRRRRRPAAGALKADRGALPAGPLLPGGLLAGGVLFLGASLQQVGMISTSAGKAGFITGLYVVLVPLAGLLWGQKAGWRRWLGALLALSGLFLLSVSERFTVVAGDLWVLSSALFWTAHVLVLGWLSPRVDPLKLAAWQFAFCSALSLAAALLFEPFEAPALLSAALPILYGGVASVGIAYTLQVVAQKTAPPAHAAILLSLEGVFAVLGGWLLLGEELSARAAVGCALMLAGMLFSQAAARRKTSPAQAG